MFQFVYDFFLHLFYGYCLTEYKCNQLDYKLFVWDKVKQLN